MFARRTLLGAACAAAFAALTAPAAMAQDVTLRMHQMLPPIATVPRVFLTEWAAKVEAESGGRIKIERYDAMALGGTPPELVDQAVDGIADIIWTVIGYTPGRFPQTEVFELPFMVENAEAASAAFWQMYEKDMQAEFADVKVLGLWVHGPGMFHTNKPVTKPADLQGMKIRGGSRLVNQLLEAVGATPVGMPVPAVSEALSKGVIDGTTIPWEVTPALKVSELVSNHTGFEGPGLYTLTFLFGMNKDAYDAMPDDLKAVIDANAGLETSVWGGRVMREGDAPGLKIATERGNTIMTIAGDDLQPWRDAVAPVYDGWIADMAARGIDGQALIDEARALMAAYGG